MKQYDTPRTRADWSEIPPSETQSWNKRLLETDASMFQYPYWNESLRRLRLRPHYLVHGSPSAPAAYVCVLITGVPGFRVGLIQRGPVALEPRALLDPEWARDIREWARRQSCILLRFTHSDDTILRTLSSVGACHGVDPFPLYSDPSEELTVELCEDESLLASFSQTARKQVRRASREGYEIRVEHKPEDFERVYPLIIALGQRKRFSHRPLSSYFDLIRLGAAYGCTQLYTAYLGASPVEALLVCRDRKTAYGVVAALDVHAIKGKHTPSFLLYVHAMHNLWSLGCAKYCFGSKSGNVFEFKSRFHPDITVRPPPMTMVVNKALFTLWTLGILRILPALRRLIRWIISRGA
jgi:Acetyltransferase (GNAT) domain